MKHARVWTNIFFLVPLGFAIAWHVYWYIPVLSLSVLLSFLYHSSREIRFKKSDIGVAWTLMGCNLLLLIFGGFRPLSLALADVVVAGLAIYIFTTQSKENYNIRHSVYHFLAAGICLVSLMVFHY